MAGLAKRSCLMLGALGLMAQDAQTMLQSLKTSGAATSGATTGLGLGAGGASPLPGRSTLPTEASTTPNPANTLEDQRLDEEIRKLKAQERGPRRFAADLFELRQRGVSSTDGGVSDEYVVGTGDQFNLHAFGSATFESPAKIDGRGMLIIPNVGSVKVGGLSLAKAREAVQSMVRRQFSNTTVDLQAMKLREVRVLVAGEVYKPGSYVVPSLSSLVNVLAQAGGPTAIGSYRQIKVLRGGKVVHALDLYPLRAEGLGNANFYLANGDTVFVPLAVNTVLLEGAFTRVTAAAMRDLEAREAQRRLLDGAPGLAEEHPGDSREERKLRLRIQRVQELLDNIRLEDAAARTAIAQGQSRASVAAPASSEPSKPAKKTGLAALWSTNNDVQRMGSAQGEDKGDEPLPMDPLKLRQHLDFLTRQLQAMKASARGDHRIDDPDELPDETSGKPKWLVRWQVDGVAPRMQFELLPGETALDALRFAGGVDVGGAPDRLSLRRLDASGAWTAMDVALNGDGKGAPEMRRGDVLSALPLQDRVSHVVKVAGWARATGDFARTEGLRVGDLLKRDGQILPNTYLSRGEITRTLPDGTERFLAFDVSKALNGDPAHNLILEDRDRVDLYRTDDLRLRKVVSATGPVQRPGNFEFLAGMRASDLLFRAGLPKRNADRMVAELAHVREGRATEIKRLDLARLLSTEDGSPVDLKDDAINPLLEPFDQLSVYAKPNYRPMRSIKLSGEVKRPGVYALESNKTTLREVVERAGGLTDEAMPQAAVFLRKMGDADPEKTKAAELSGIEMSDPTSNGLNETLARLNETKRNATSGALQNSPLLHGLETGSLSRLVVDVPSLLAKGKDGDLELQDGDEVVFPTKTSTVYVIGETASPFAAYKAESGMTVGDLVKRAGGYTRNADKGSVRLMKANGRIVDTWVSHRSVEPGDAVLVPQRIRRDVTWQENLQALTPLAILINTFKN